MKTTMKLAGVLTVALLIATMIGAFAIMAGAEESANTTEECTWNYDTSTKTLTISGNGPMADYEEEFSSPWTSYRSDCENIVITEGVTHIGKNAFYLFENSTLTIADSVTSIGDKAFHGTDIESVDLPDNLISLGEQVFSECDALTEIVIPDSVTTVGDGVFKSCDLLQSVTLSENLTDISAEMFMYCVNLKNIEIPESVKTIKKYAFYECKALTDVTIPEGVEAIYTYAFSYCDGITDLSVAESVTSIGYMAFYRCDSLTSVVTNCTSPQWDKKLFQNSNSNIFSNESEIVFTYEPSATMTVRLIAQGSGSVYHADGSATKEYKEGENIAILAYPNSGYAFIRWEESIDGEWVEVSTEDYYCFDVERSHYLRAIFQSIDTLLPSPLYVQSSWDPYISFLNVNKTGIGTRTALSKLADGIYVFDGVVPSGAVYFNLYNTAGGNSVVQEIATAGNNNTFNVADCFWSTSCPFCVYKNGFCVECGGYQSAEQNSEGYYEICNAGQLYWFAAKVANGENSINGILTADITVNESVLINGALNSDTDAVKDFRLWTPIGDSSVHYLGDFNGSGHTVSGLYYNDDSVDYVGLFGYIGATNSHASISNVGVVDSYFCGDYNVGGIVGYNSKGTVINCYSASAVSGSYNIGGIIGNNDSKLKHCYNTGTVSGLQMVGGVLGRNGGSVENCYYLDSCASTDECAVAKTALQFASGEVAYLLQSGQTADETTNETALVWGQNINNGKAVQAVPAFSDATVYKISLTDCSAVTAYSNSEVSQSHPYINGICNTCSSYEPAAQNDNDESEYYGYYEIYNAGQLFWFAEYVNSGNYDADAILMADIDLNTYYWKAIGTSSATAYTGTFNGRGFSIKNLNRNNGQNEGSRASFAYYVGTGGCITNVVFDAPSVFCQGHASANASAVVALRNSGTISNCMVVGGVVQLGNYAYLAGIAGVNETGGVIENCGVVNTELTRRFGHTLSRAAITHLNNGTVKNCFAYGCVYNNDNDANGGIIVSGNAPENCYYYTEATVAADYGTAVTAQQFACGEAAYLLNGDQTTTIWKQTIETDAYPKFSSLTVYKNQIGGCTESTFVYSFSNNQAEALTTHTDENRDHICDADCGESEINIDQHLDGDDADHLCDYGCEKQADDGCYDANDDADHNCDECGEESISEHIDKNKDHYCDNGCVERIGEHADGDDNNHLCDYGCGAIMEDCEPNEDDGDCTTDITCSVCGAVTTEGADSHAGGTATCTEKAICTVCDTEYGEMLAHDHGTAWVTDGAEHWNECECGDKANVASHAGGTATCTEKAICTVCDSEYGEMLAHNHGTTCRSDADNHWNECECGDKANVASHAGGTATCTEKAICTVCDSEYGEMLAHNHGTTWKSDADNHWNECECGDKANVAAHTDVNGDGKCDSCDYEIGVSEDGGSAAEPSADTDPTVEDPDNSEKDEEGLGTSAVAAIVICSAAGVGGGGFALLRLVIKKKRW